MRRWSAHRFRQQALANGLSSESASEAWAIVDRLQNAGLPPALTLRHLAALSGSKYGLLRRLVSRRGVRSQYRSFRITKRSGGVRRIYVAKAGLASFHRWTHDNILMSQSVHPRAFAYKRKTTIVDCASEHCGARWLVKFDVENFFESFDEISVYRLFQDMGYTPLLSFELSRILTVPRDYLTRKSMRTRERDGDTTYPRTPTGHIIKEYSFDERGVLGQGLCTSPVVSNLLCAKIDAELDRIAVERGFVYTRYADDITFSTDRKRLPRKEIKALRLEVLAVLHARGLGENKKKFSVAGPGARRIVLGLLVDGERPRVSRATRARIDGHLHWLEKNGPAAHATARGFRSIDGLREHLHGLLAHIKQVDERLYEQYSVRASQIKWPPM